MQIHVVIAMNPKWKWYKADLENVKKNGLKVFSTFSCGGGSSYGYKLAGYELIGNCEIDSKINAMYVKNHKPKYNFNMDIRDFNRLPNLPKELFELDILDGSPPCSTFSMAGEREKNWGKEKRFKEGQKKQVLDDLFFAFLNTVERLQPKVVVAENVDGMTRGNAKYYITMVIKEFRRLGYDVQIFRLNAMFMNVPQSRVRIFFIANRMGFPKLTIDPDEKPILFREIASKNARPMRKTMKAYSLMKNYMTPSDISIGTINKRVKGKESSFNSVIVRLNKVCPTLTSGGSEYREDLKYMMPEEYVNASTFPQDYDFNGNPHKYVCGMSVPPRMMEYIAKEIEKQWFRR